MAQYTYQNTQNAIDFVKGTRSLAKLVVENEGDNTKDIIFASSEAEGTPTSGTIFVGGKEFGLGVYYPGVSSTAVSKSGLGQMSSGYTPAHFAGRTIGDILDEILFISPSTLTVKGPSTAKVFNGVATADNAYPGTTVAGKVSVTFLCDQSVTVKSIKIGNFRYTTNLGLVTSDGKNTYTLSNKDVYLNACKDALTETNGRARVISETGALTTAGATGWNGDTYYYWTTSAGTKLVSSTITVIVTDSNDKTYTDTVSIPLSFVNQAPSAAFITYPSCTLGSYYLSKYGVKYIEVGSTFTDPTVQYTTPSGLNLGGLGYFSDGTTGGLCTYVTGQTTTETNVGAITPTTSLTVTTAKNLNKWSSSATDYVYAVLTSCSNAGSYSLPYDYSSWKLNSLGYLYNSAGIASTSNDYYVGDKSGLTYTISPLYLANELQNTCSVVTYKKISLSAGAGLENSNDTSHATTNKAAINDKYIYIYSDGNICSGAGTSTRSVTFTSNAWAIPSTGLNNIIKIDTTGITGYKVKVSARYNLKTNGSSIVTSKFTVDVDSDGNVSINPHSSDSVTVEGTIQLAFSIGETA